MRPSLSCTSAARGDQVGIIAVGDAAQGFDRTGDDDHAQGFEGAGGDGRADVGGAIEHIGQGFDLAWAVIRFVGDGDGRGLGDDDMRFDIRRLFQDFEQADAVNLAGGAGEGDDEALGHSQMVG